MQSKEEELGLALYHWFEYSGGLVFILRSDGSLESKFYWVSFILMNIV